MFYLSKKQQYILKNALIIIFSSFLVSSTLAQQDSDVWFVMAGASGDGTTAENPLGSLASLESVSRPSDLIIVLPGEVPLDGGLALKRGQTLVGLPQAGLKPIITNSDTARNQGNGIILAGGNRIWNIRIENTYANGIIGNNVSGSRIEEVEVFGANQSKTSLQINTPQGGILFLSKGAGLSVENYIVHTEIIDAAAFGVYTRASGGAHSRLVINDCRIEKGTRVKRMDVGIAGWAEGPSSQLDLEVDRCTVQGRTSPDGRNIVVFAARDAKATVVIERSNLGTVGQDGVLVTASGVPAEINLDIRESVIENAGHTNVESTILNLPASDPARAEETNISISIENSIIRNAGHGDNNNDNDYGNIWMGSGDMAQQLAPESTVPLASGHFRFTLRNCQVTGGKDFGIGFGQMWPNLAPPKSTFQVLLQDNKIMNNGTAEIMIAAPGARIDARRNCWGTENGLSKDRIRMLSTATSAQLDASEPLSCEQ